MNCLRQVIVAGVALALVAGCGDGEPPADTLGQIAVRLTTQPSDVTAIHVVVSAPDLAVPVQGDLTAGGGGWFGSLEAVPPGAGRTVTAYAYDDATLIYQGSTGNVSVLSGELTSVIINLLPYPNDTGGPGLNTPPHFVTLSHRDAINVNEAVTLVVNALDPDDDTMLTYTLSATPGGTFSDGNVDGDDVGNVVVNRQPGNPVVITFTPPEDFTGFVLVQVGVSDGQATTTSTFSIAVGAGITPGIQFAVLPDLVIADITPQSVMPNGSSQITYTLNNPTANPMRVYTSWSDVDCGGSFTAGDSAVVGISQYTLAQRTVTYTATNFTPPSGLSSCSFRLSITDDAGASLWSTMTVWIEEPFTMFVSGFTVQGATFAGQIEAADAACQLAATNGVVPAGAYKALLSFDQISARDRLIDGPYILSNGDPVARNKAELFSRNLMNPIHLDENGADVVGLVFTGTGSDGSASYRCDNWTSSDPSKIGMLGQSQSFDAGWTAAEAPSCDTWAHVYCVQQSHDTN